MAGRRRKSSRTRRPTRNNPTLEPVIPVEIREELGPSSEINSRREENQSVVDTVEVVRTIEEKTEVEQLRDQVNNLMKEMEKLKNEKSKEMEEPNKKKVRFEEPMVRTLNPPTILNNETPYRTWKKIVANELTSMNLYLLIDANGVRPDNVSEDRLPQLEGAVVTYLLTRLDDQHWRLINEQKTAREIIKKLDSIKENTSLAQVLALHHKFSGMRFDKTKEKAQDFILKYEEMVAELERAGDTIEEYRLKIKFYSSDKELLPGINRKS